MLSSVAWYALGRDDLETLNGVRRARRATGRAAFVLEGEPGIGKTTLWEAGVDAARERGRTASSSCRPAGERGAVVVRGARRPARGRAAGDARGAARRRGGARSRSRCCSRTRTGGRRISAAIGLAVLGAFRALARPAPVLVAIDDAQWLDAPTAAVLEFALRRLRREPVGVLVAGRTDAPGEARARAGAAASSACASGR